MGAKKNIDSRSDIEMLVDKFYEKVIKDDLLSPIFLSIAQFDWNTHIPVMYDFWETVLFRKGNYKGNPVSKHIALDSKSKLKPKHFERWKFLFFETIDAFFEGSVAQEAKKKVEMMEKLMLFKIDASRKDFFIQ
ncbi:MAG: group III truncated hemoglobin [Bacteroidota bacterium]